MKQALVAVGVIAFVVLSALIAAYFGRGGLTEGSFDKGQRFKAKPGTTRKNAILLTSNKRPETEDPDQRIARRADEEEDDTPLTVKSLSAPSGEERSGPAHESAREALNSTSPEAGLRALDHALTLPHDGAQAAYLHEAKGQLYARLEPPDYEKARAAFERARKLAGDRAQEENVLLKSVQVLMQGGQDDAAREQLASGLDGEGPPSGTRLRLQLLQGQLAERAGQPEKAETVYRQVMETALATPEALTRETALMLARTAGLRLTSLYRDNDRSDAADLLAKDLQKQLKRIEDTT